jgi:hypothetical protein
MKEVVIAYLGDRYLIGEIKRLYGINGEEISYIDGCICTEDKLSKLVSNNFHEHKINFHESVPEKVRIRTKLIQMAARCGAGYRIYG